MIIETLPDASLLITRCPECAQRIAVKRWAHVGHDDTLKKSSEDRICPSCEAKWKIVSIPLGPKPSGMLAYEIIFRPIKEK
jgi:hypothetical protein